MERGQGGGTREGLTAFVALLRGVNVGGANALPMASLRELFRTAGAEDVETLIQSGNVIFSARADAADRIAAEVADRIALAHGFNSRIVTRDAPGWRAMVDDNPFVVAGVASGELHVALLSAAADPARLARLDPKRSPPDAFAATPRCVYLRLPNGVARSKLTNAWLDSTLGLTSTIRNWATVVRIARALDARCR